MSGQAQEVYGTLLQVDKLLSDIELKIDKLQGSSGGGGAASATGQVAALKKELHSANIILMNIGRWSGSDSLSAAVNKVQDLTVITMRLYMLMTALNALAAGPTPVGLLYAGAMAVGFGMSTYTFMNSVGE